ncbi:MAG: hypothetical protein KGR16_07575, partial [Verrucomicrobia bacterium]|nr:hypothetical protein [Verrucomicrobiota bacterium]
QNSSPERATIALGQGASEEAHFEANSTMPKTDSSGCFGIPLGMSAYKIPTTYVEIQGHKYAMEIDLGSKTALTLHKSVLEQIKKTSAGTSRWMNVKGEKYETPKYSIQEVKIGNFSVHNASSKEESGNFANHGSILVQDSACQAEQQAGRIGRDLFSHHNLFLDCHRLVCFICSHVQDLRKSDYQLDRFTQTPMHMTSDGVVIEVDTDIGAKRFLLDTGSTISVIRNIDIPEKIAFHNAMPVYESSKFLIRGTDFGKQILYLLDISPDFKDSDGILGMNFFNEHAVFLDFTKNVVYIGRSSEVLRPTD